MAGKAPIPNCTKEDRESLEQMVRSRTEEFRMIERARIILKCLAGDRVNEIAKVLHVRPNTVIEWRRRFEKEGVKGLKDRPRSGKPVRYDAKFRQDVLNTLKLPPPGGQTHWDGPAVAKHLDTSVHAVWRLLRKEGICLSRQRSWCVCTTPEFIPKAADIVGLYLNPPENALVISVDEKPGSQALEPATGHVETDIRKIARGLKSRYRRHGVLNLFAALEAATGAIRTQTTQHKHRFEFTTFIDQVLAGLSADREIHVIFDNYFIQKKNDKWPAAHPNVHFHFTSTFAGWLNQVEIWFSIMSGKTLGSTGCESVQHLLHAIGTFVTAYGPNARPFVWRKLEVKESQLRDTIIDFYK